MVEIYFAKTKENAIIPSKEDGDAGYDIYANFENDTMVIYPHETKIIPTGIACALPEDYYFQVEERGSTGSRGIKKSAGVIDASYRGEIFIAITNNDMLIISKLEKDETQMLYDDPNIVYYPYDKAIAQLVLHLVPKARINEIRYEKLQKMPSHRMLGKLGSSRK